MASVPRRNLGPESEPWGRSVDQRLIDLRGAVDLGAEANRNAFKGVNASLGGVTRTLTELAHQQGQLTRHQAELAEQQRELEYVVEGFPDHQIRSGGEEMDTVTGSWQPVADMSINIQDTHNYVWVLVSNNGSFVGDNSTGYISVKTEVFIDGSSHGAWTANYLYNSSAYQCAVSNTYQYGTMTNLDGDVRIVVSVMTTNASTVFSSKRVSSNLSVVSYRR